MNSAAQLGVIALLSLAASGGTWLVHKPAPAPVPVACDPSKLLADEICPAGVSGKVTWVDARSRAEWKKDGMKGSVLWNLDPAEDANAMEAAAAASIYGAELVVVYCGSEACGTSRQVAERIRKMDLGPQVKVLRGGWAALKGNRNLRGSSLGS